MIVVDSSALVAVLRGEPEADGFLRAIASQPCLLSSVSLLEISLKLAGRDGDAARWRELDALILRARMDVVPHDAGLARVARQAFLAFGKGRHKAGLNLGDCAAYALAKDRGLALLFKGHDFSCTDLMAAAIPD